MSKKPIEYYDPKTDKFPYPKDTSSHYLIVKKNNGLEFDENYPYIDNSKKFRFKRFWVRFLIVILVFLLTKIRLGLKVRGKKILRRNKALIKKGVISVSNHVHMWDYLAIMKVVRRYNWPNVLVWATNIRGEQSKNIRAVGGIPIPDNNYKGTKKYIEEVCKLLDQGKWLQIYAEGSMWEYYKPIRPFKRGISYFAIKCDKPIIPMAFSYRRPNWIRRKIFKQIACFTLNIGEPIFANKSLDKKEMEEDLTRRCHEEVCRLAGIDPKENLYEAIYNNSERIDYYTDTYGVNYKGSR